MRLRKVSSGDGTRFSGNYLVMMIHVLGFLTPKFDTATYLFLKIDMRQYLRSHLKLDMKIANNSDKGHGHSSKLKCDVGDSL